MAKGLPSKPPGVPPDLNDPRMTAFLGGAQVQSPAGVSAQLLPAAEKVAPAAMPPAEKVIKDGFSMPQADYELIEMAIQRALDHRIVMSKSGVLRAAVRALAALEDGAFRARVAGVEEIKPGRKKGR